MLISSAAEDLFKIPHECWADYAFHAHRYGQRTSNLVEQQNNVYREAREKPILDLLQHIWDDTMEKRYQRELKAQAEVGQLSTPASEKRRKDQDDSMLYHSH